MGSFNTTCKVSGATIREGNDAVMLLLEPNSDDGNHIIHEPINYAPHYLVSSLPIYGKYDDYGMVKAEDEKSSSLDIAKKMYGLRVGYDEPEGRRLSLGGMHDDYKLDTYPWIVKRSVFDAIVSAGDLLNEKEAAISDDNLKSLMHKALLSKLEDKDLEHSKLSSFLSGFKALGLQFQYKGNLGRHNSHQCKIKAILKSNELASKPTDLCVKTYVCGITNKAISPGTPIRVIPLESNHNKSTNPIFLNCHQVEGLYGLGGVSFKGEIGDKGEIIAEKNKNNTSTLNLLSFISKDDFESLDDAIDSIEKGHAEFEDHMGKVFKKDFMVVTEDAYQNISISSNTYLNSYDFMGKSVSEFFDIPLSAYESEKAFEDFVSKTDSKAIKHYYQEFYNDTISFYLEQENLKAEPSETIKQIKRSMTWDMFRNLNEYSDDKEFKGGLPFLSTVFKDDTFIGQSISDGIKHTFFGAFRDEYKDFNSEWKRVRPLVEKFNDDSKFVTGLHYASIPLAPSTRMSGEPHHSIQNQHDIIDDINNTLLAELKSKLTYDEFNY